MIKPFSKNKYNIPRYKMVKECFYKNATIKDIMYNFKFESTKQLDVYLGLMYYTRLMNNIGLSYKQIILDVFSTDETSDITKLGIVLLTYGGQRSRYFISSHGGKTVEYIQLNDIISKLKNESVKKYIIDNLNYF